MFRCSDASVRLGKKSGASRLGSSLDCSDAAGVKEANKIIRNYFSASDLQESMGFCTDWRHVRADLRLNELS